MGQDHPKKFHSINENHSRQLKATAMGSSPYYISFPYCVLGTSLHLRLASELAIFLCPEIELYPEPGYNSRFPSYISAMEVAGQ